MAVTVRPYDTRHDYQKVDRFLIEVFDPSDHQLNWMQPRWEYMHAHPYIENFDLRVIAIFEEDGEIVGVAHPEDKPTFVYFQRRPGYDHILPLMFDHADQKFGGPSIMLNRTIIGLFINDFDILARNRRTEFKLRR